MRSENRLEKRLRTAGTILILGLLVEGACLLGRGPISFLLFVTVGGLLLFAGVSIFLLALVRGGGEKARPD